MNNISLIYVNSFAILILVLVLRNYRQKFRYICCEEKVFVLFILATMVMLCNEALIENLWFVRGPVVRVLLYILQTLDYSLAVIIPMLWLYYCLYRIYHISKVRRWIRWLIALPATAYLAVVLVLLPSGAAFGFSEDNGFIEGSAYILSYIVGIFYIAAAAVFILRKRKALSHGELIPYLLVPAIPVALALVELALDSLIGLMWAGTSLVILEIQMFVLNNKTTVDHLTSLNNRMALDAYIRRSIQECHSNYKPLGLIMMDVDDFKHINDRYGHVEGDRALKATADILRECFAGKHFIARYGGDEFVAVIKDCSREDMEQYLKTLETVRVKQNSAAQRPYEIRLSIGANVFREGDITSLHRLFMKVDELMYQDKNAKKKTAAAVE